MCSVVLPASENRGRLRFCVPCKAQARSACSVSGAASRCDAATPAVLISTRRRVRSSSGSKSARTAVLIARRKDVWVTSALAGRLVRHRRDVPFGDHAGKLLGMLLAPLLGQEIALRVDVA